ncbi:MAG: GNAT family N-acetyltransferase [Chloroflexota bacterium]
MSLKIRPAVPHDVDAAVPLIYSSGPDAFEFVFAHEKTGDAQAFLRAAFVHGQGEFGYLNHVVVEQNGEIVGSGAAFSGQDMLGFTIAAAGQMFRFYGLSTALGIIRRGLQIEQILVPPRKQELCIAHLGVKPECRGTGVGTKLIDYLLAEGKKLGRETAVLDVSTHNPRAEALYSRLGFVVTKEIVSTYQNRYGRVHNHRRMALALA